MKLYNSPTAYSMLSLLGLPSIVVQDNLVLPRDEALVRQTQHRLSERSADARLEQAPLLQPEVPHEFAFAVRAALGIAVGLRAWNAHEIIRLVEFVADVIGKSTLFGGPGILPVAAVRVFDFVVGTGRPRREHVVCSWYVLRDDEPSVIGDLAVAVFVPLLVGVESHGESGFLGDDAPAVEEPFEWEREVREDGIGVDGDAHVVRFEDAGESGGLGPIRGAVRLLVDADEVVLVAVDRC